MARNASPLPGSETNSKEMAQQSNTCKGSCTTRQESAAANRQTEQPASRPDLSSISQHRAERIKKHGCILTR